MELITNRTNADVIRAAEINKKIYAAWSSMSAVQADDVLIDPIEAIESTLTEEEIAEWKSGLKGAYNYTDLNRVESTVAELSNVLSLGLVTKTDWSVLDIPTKADMERYANNLKIVRNAFLSSVAIPDVMSGLTYISANNIEKMLLDSYKRLDTHKVWEKKPADVEYDWKYTEDKKHESIGKTGTDYRWSFYGGMISAARELSFDARSGFDGREQEIGLNEAKGCYIVANNKCEARQIIHAEYTGNTDDNGGNGTRYEMRYRYTVVGYATRSWSAYCTAGNESIGCYLVPNGKLPSGTLIEGSYDAGYCFVEDGGSYYYYVRR